MKLKKWVKVILAIILFVSIFIMASECEDTTTFIVSHLVALATSIISVELLFRY